MNYGRKPDLASKITCWITGLFPQPKPNWVDINHIPGDMSAQIPPSKPKASLQTVQDAALAQWLKKHAGTPLPEFYVLAVRGYYRDTMGRKGANDVGMYDDAFFIVSPLGFSAWNGNTDPSRLGWNPNADKYMARLQAGCWKFIHLKHHASRPDGYYAFGQGSNPVTVDRVEADGDVHNSDTGCFGINLHRGGSSGTSSEGCNTVPKEQWDAFYTRLHGTMRTLGVQTFDFILTDGPIN